MLVGINGNEANVTHRVGSGQYAFELISHLATLASGETKFKIYLEAEPMSDFPKPSDFWEYKVIPHQRLWTLTALQKALLREKLQGTAPDVFFTPSHYAPLYMPIPSVIAIMDLSFERFPTYFKKKDYFQLKYWSWICAKQAKHILTISQFSKKEITAIYSLPENKVTVTLLGYDEARFNGTIKKQTAKIKEIKQKYKISGDYLLFLGTLQPRKNLLRLIEAFSQLENKSLQLVIVGMINEGRGGWMNAPIFERVKELGLETRVVFTGFAPDPEAPYLMAGAMGYVLPSLYEGFGIPPIEAMAVGTPVIVSKVSSLPEICGEAAIYIDDPYSVDSIKVAMEAFLALSPAEREKKAKLGLGYVTRYNWQATAQETLTVLKRVASS